MSVIRLPFPRRAVRRCYHVWSEPTIERTSYRGQPARATWICVKCGRRELVSDAA